MERAAAVCVSDAGAAPRTPAHDPKLVCLPAAKLWGVGMARTNPPST